MRNDFKTSADALGMEFVYGRKDYQNLLQDSLPDTCYLFVDPPKGTPEKSLTGAIISRTFVGRFMLLEKSSLDEHYDENSDDHSDVDGVISDAKYQSHIEPMIVKLDEKLIPHLEGCGEGYEIKYSYTEIINVFAEGMDGLLVNYTAKIYA